MCPNQGWHPNPMHFSMIPAKIILLTKSESISDQVKARWTTAVEPPTNKSIAGRVKACQQNELATLVAKQYKCAKPVLKYAKEWSMSAPNDFVWLAQCIGGNKYNPLHTKIRSATRPIQKCHIRQICMQCMHWKKNKAKQEQQWVVMESIIPIILACPRQTCFSSKSSSTTSSLLQEHDSQINASPIFTLWLLSNDPNFPKSNLLLYPMKSSMKTT